MVPAKTKVTVVLSSFTISKGTLPWSLHLKTIKTIILSTKEQRAVDTRARALNKENH